MCRIFFFIAKTQCRLYCFVSIFFCSTKRISTLGTRMQRSATVLILLKHFLVKPIYEAILFQSITSNPSPASKTTMWSFGSHVSTLTLTSKTSCSHVSPCLVVKFMRINTDSLMVPLHWTTISSTGLVDGNSLGVIINQESTEFFSFPRLRQFVSGTPEFLYLYNDLRLEMWVLIISCPNNRFRILPGDRVFISLGLHGYLLRHHLRLPRLRRRLQHGETAL